MNENIVLKNTGESASLNINFSGNKTILSENNVDLSLNLYDVYVSERSKSNKFRLVVSISPYCSNILFNPFTEIIKYYEKDNEEKICVLPQESIDSGITTSDMVNNGILNEKSVIGKDITFSGITNNGGFKWNTYSAIRDTQLSNDRCGFEYFCGVDIFNNHLLRNKTFKMVLYDEKNSNESISNYKDIYKSYDIPVNAKIDTKYIYTIDHNFNTIDDYLRNRDGIILPELKLVSPGYGIMGGSVYERMCPMHLYQRYDVYTFKESIDKNINEINGWFGFYNKSNIGEKIDDDSSNELNIDRVINSKKQGEFIDLYPTRELFSFSDVYNKHKKRLEKNWNHYLTYPSKSIIRMFNGKDFPFFHIVKNADKEIASLKVLMFDEYTVSDDGRETVTIYCVCQHGLSVGDRINLYVEKKVDAYNITYKDNVGCAGGSINMTSEKNDTSSDGVLLYESVEVVYVYDKFIFQILKTNGNISNKWIDLNSETGRTIETSDGNIYEVNKTYLYDKKNVKKYPITYSNRCNIDETISNVYFRRVVDGVECNYYVRVFSKLPNFKFADSEINDETLYGKSSASLNLIERYSKNSSFESHSSNESFSKTAYGDNNTEIVFTDDIDISYLRDNLGRPLSEIYFTILKNNNGYKKWYGIGTDANPNDDSVEMSHCFGKNSSSFLLNDFYRDYIKTESGEFNDVRDISLSRLGLLYKNSNDEIENDVSDFYGDICYYSPVECEEFILQSTHNRFNTVQREIGYYNDVSLNSKFYNGTMYYDEVKDDESGIIKLNAGIILDLVDFYAMFNTKKFSQAHCLRHSKYNSHIIDNSKDMNSFSGLTRQSEGYFYKSHYRIKLKTISEKLNSDEPIKYDIYEIVNDNNFLRIKTLEPNYLEKNDKLILYLKNKNVFYYLTVVEIIDGKYFVCDAKNESCENSYIDSSDLSIDNLSLLKRKETTPYYAKIINDGSCRFYWRNIVSNGIESTDTKVYPFTNGSFYINKKINFYLRRQDPEENGEFYTSGHFIYVKKGEDVSEYVTYENDDYYENDEIVC